MHLLPREAPVFVDVGANFGLLSLGLWHLTGGRLKARLYEPNPHLCTIIDRSIALNKAESLALVPGAAMASAGQVSLHFSLAHTGGGYVGNEGGGVAVNAVVLDRDLEESNVKQVDLMKIDVEGNEGEVLAGLAGSLENRRIRAIYFEYCPAHIRRSKARFDPVNSLLTAGYEVFAWNAGEEAEFGPATHWLDSQTGLGADRIPLVELTAPPEIRTADLLALPPGRAFPMH
jgi:FkbM family methyltransferase